MKQIYISAWVLLTIAIAGAVWSGTSNPVGLLIFSLVVLALILSLALWSVYVQTRNLKTE